MAWGTKTITPRDYFTLATHQFPHRGSPLTAWKVADSETFYSHGLVATAYINEDHRQVVIAFQIISKKTSLPQQTINCARDFASHAKNQSRRLGYKTYYTGRLMGGSLAELCAIQDKLPAYTFDSVSVLETADAA